VRTQYETQAMLEAEHDVIKRFTAGSDLEYRKLPLQYRADYAILTSGTLVSWVEVKIRTKKYSTYMVSLAKILGMINLSSASKKPAYLLVQYPDALLLHSVTENDLSYIGWGGRNDARDAQDEEPVCYIPMEQFREVLL
jgi:hypothetical protein